MLVCKRPIKECLILNNQQKLLKLPLKNKIVKAVKFRIKPIKTFLNQDNSDYNN